MRSLLTTGRFSVERFLLMKQLTRKQHQRWSTWHHIYEGSFSLAFVSFTHFSASYFLFAVRDPPLLGYSHYKRDRTERRTWTSEPIHPFSYLNLNSATYWLCVCGKVA